jgi:hypothetical protein
MKMSNIQTQRREETLCNKELMHIVFMNELLAFNANSKLTSHWTSVHDIAQNLINTSYSVIFGSFRSSSK